MLFTKPCLKKHLREDLGSSSVDGLAMADTSRQIRNRVDAQAPAFKPKKLSPSGPTWNSTSSELLLEFRSLHRPHFLSDLHKRYCQSELRLQQSRWLSFQASLAFACALHLT